MERKTPTDKHKKSWGVFARALTFIWRYWMRNFWIVIALIIATIILLPYMIVCIVSIPFIKYLKRWKKC